MRPFASFTAVLLLLVGAVPAAEQAADVQTSLRERLSINDGWRFAKGDPPSSTISLLYDVRPEVRAGTRGAASIATSGSPRHSRCTWATGARS